MLRKLFSLEGELDRRGYLLWTLVGMAIPTLVVVALSLSGLFILRADLTDELRPIEGPFILFTRLAPHAILALFMWISFAVSAKRLRHMGLRPVPVIIGVCAVGAAVSALGPAVLGVAAASLLTAVVAYGYPAAMLLWPGKAGAQRGATLADTFA